MRRHSQELYKGQRNKEKYELFKHFYHPAIADVYKQKLFALFDHKCFKCGAPERDVKKYGGLFVLCMDHHIPMARGGKLVLGNIVSLCRKCNGEKLDLPPEAFYSPEELETLRPILQQQIGLFDFKLDRDALEQDIAQYFISLGVPPETVNELMTDPDHRDYIGPREALFD